MASVSQLLSLTIPISIFYPFHFHTQVVRNPNPTYDDEGHEVTEAAQALCSCSRCSDYQLLWILRTTSGTFHDGDLLLNLKGLRLTSDDKENRPSDAKEIDLQFSLEDLETIKVIGKGSGGIVQLVRHKWIGRLFALKVIQMNIQEDIRKQIVQELKINQASQCPHIVVCYHSFYHNGAISLVFEYMDRGSLTDVIRQLKTILEPYLAVLCKQVLQGLVYLHHERHVIHRDIKPSNLLVNQKGEVKITDFGVSAMLANSMGQRDTFVGTYNYMSPERISGKTYDYKSDIWSLGLVILECAIGRFPYIQSEDQQNWPTFYELLDAIVSKPPPAAPSDQFSPEFCSFISSCIQKEPKDRSSALELLSHPFIKKFEDKDIDLAILVILISYVCGMLFCHLSHIESINEVYANDFLIDLNLIHCCCKN
uniref:mitogen-activated protein kinase kinase n=1 Tax=Lactuca sativa TaxID=4236 RepID=A0A9R1VEF4_LACSA|nr:hypothetical protein LSAT_V11C500281410 [Lactuca sativa]